MASIDISANAPPLGAPSPDAAEGAAPQRHCFVFSGTGGEYFRIWIVNVLLSILTLGIYSAWAKVRNKRYFYGSTALDGASFEYIAEPVKILKGRILVVSVLLIYQLAAVYAPPLVAVIGLALVFLLPWAVIRALAFNARYSSYRNLRFHFDGKYAEAFRLYILWTILAVFTLGLAYPYAIYLRKRFMVERSRYGQSSFVFRGRRRYFYVVYVIAAVVIVGLFVGMTVILPGVAAILNTFGGPEADSGGSQTEWLVMVTVLAFNLGVLAVFLGAAIVVQTAITNYVFRQTRIAGVRFDMRMEPLRVLWIQLSNIVVIVLSVGMMIPWARVRIVGYRLSCLSLLTTEPLDGFAASERQKLSATGEEMGEALDLDLGL
jgi:uncharacterized membrane protein YjgN (DUF898 family)